MASLVRSLTSVARVVSVRSSSICVTSSMLSMRSPMVSAVRSLASSKKPVAAAVVQKKQPVEVEAPEETEAEEYQVPTPAEAKATLTKELKAEIEENGSVIGGDESISKEYLTEINGKVSTDASTGDNILTFNQGGYAIRVRWNKNQYEESGINGENEDAQFSDEEGREKKSDNEEADKEEKLGSIPFDIDVDNGKTTIRFVAEAQDNSMLISAMGFPDLSKENRARVAESEARVPLPADVDSMPDIVNIEHMTDNAQDALEGLWESLRINDELAQYVIHSCLIAKRQAHQNVLMGLSSFIGK